MEKCNRKPSYQIENIQNAKRGYGKWCIAPTAPPFWSYKYYLQHPH